MSRLWAVTSYFNPGGGKVRRRNFRAFREALTVPLAAAELSFDGDFDLGDDAAEILVRRRGGDVVWQKERLLNLALAALPAECDRVAWLDGDVLFADDGWVDGAHRSLDAAPLVQPFRLAHQLPPGATAPAGPQDVEWSSIGWACHRELGREAGRDAPGKLLPMPWTGYAWVARREILDGLGFYDAMIAGSADAAMALAAVGEFDRVLRLFHMEGSRADHFLAWARPFHERVAGEVGWVDAELYHLWHGPLLGRRYVTRHRELARYAFDPRTDLAVDEEGLWKWSSEKPELHRFVRDYCLGREREEEAASTS